MNISEKKQVRNLRFVTSGYPTSDGAGVKLTRLIGSHEISMLDPFLLLDSFESDQSQDYMAGFPPHPHRGFETVTYMLAGRMRHKDSVGNEGVIEQHGVQWMTAGKGIIHSEMPEQESGLMHGFQLWVNLPKANKMTAPKYQEFPANEMAIEHGEQGELIRVISGKTDKGTIGPVVNEFVKPTYMDISLPIGGSFTQTLAEHDNAMLFVIAGHVSVGSDNRALKEKTLGILTSGEQVVVQAKTAARFLIIAGKPLNEPVARGGPFVMNSRQEVEQAFSDYQQGRFAKS